MSIKTKQRRAFLNNFEKLTFFRVAISLWGKMYQDCTFRNSSDGHQANYHRLCLQVASRMTRHACERRKTTSTWAKTMRWQLMGKKWMKRYSLSEDKVAHRVSPFRSTVVFYRHKKSRLRIGVTWFLTIASGGILRLFFHWFPRLKLLATHSKCPLREAETALVVETFQGRHANYYVEKIERVRAKDVS